MSVYSFKLDPMDQEDINNQQRANALKAKIKTTFRDIDEGKSGCVKEKLFFDILALNSIKLSKSNEQKVKERLTKNGKIDYKEAISRLAPDLTAPRPFESEWTLRFGDSKQSTRNDLMSLRTLTKRIMTSNTKDSRTPDARRMKDNYQIMNMSTINEETPTNKSQYPLRARSQTPSHSSRPNLQAGNKRAKTPNRINSVNINLNATTIDPAMQNLLQELGAVTQKKKKDIYTYEHEDNYNIINNQYFDYNVPAHYKTEDLKSKSQIDYPDYTSAVAADENSASKSIIPISKTNKNLGTYQTTKFQNSPESLKNIAEKYGANIENVISLLKKCMEAQIDSRTLNNVKMEYIRINKDFVSVEEFRSMFKGILKKLWDQSIENRIVEILTDDIDKNAINFKKVSDLVDFYHYYPLIIKKDKNFSQELYTVLTSNKGTNHEFNVKRLQNSDENSQDLNMLLAYLWGKIEERFQKVANAFRFFDISSAGKISFSEFSLAVERLFLKISPENLSSIFKYLDKNQDRFVDYTEFCRLCEEKRRDIDPFDESQSGRVTRVKQRGNSETPRIQKIKPIEIEGGSPNLKNATTKKQYENELPSYKDINFTYGIKSMPPENMDAIITNDYQKEWLEKQRLNEIEHQRHKQDNKHYGQNIILKPNDVRLRKLKTERGDSKYSTIMNTPSSLNSTTHRNEISFGAKLPRLTPSPDMLAHKRRDNSRPYSKLDAMATPNINRKMISNEEYIRELKERKGVMHGYGKDFDDSIVVNPKNIFREKSQSPTAKHTNNLSFTMRNNQLSPLANERIELPQVNKPAHNRGESLTINVDDRKAQDTISKKYKEDTLSQYYTDKRTLKMKSPMNGGKSSRLNMTAL